MCITWIMVIWIPQNQTLGKKPGLLGAMTGDDAGNIWFAFANNLVRWDGAHYSKFSFTDPQLEISVTMMAIGASTSGWAVQLASTCSPMGIST
jgi:hypothetical protein